MQTAMDELSDNDAYAISSAVIKDMRHNPHLDWVYNVLGIDRLCDVLGRTPEFCHSFVELLHIEALVLSPRELTLHAAKLVDLASKLFKADHANHVSVHLFCQQTAELLATMNAQTVDGYWVDLAYRRRAMMDTAYALCMVGNAFLLVHRALPECFRQL